MTIEIKHVRDYVRLLFRHHSQIGVVLVFRSIGLKVGINF